LTHRQWNIDMETKTCNKCGEEKPLELFYGAASNKDNLSGHCKSCKAKYGRVWRGKNPDYYSKYAVSHRKSICETSNQWNKDNPDKARCRGIVWRALKNGDIFKESCVVCGNHNSQAHHDDYSLPLDIIWLCNKHHKELHRKYDND